MKNNVVTGIAGLGNMGLAVAARLTALGGVVGFDPDPSRRAVAVAQGITPVEALSGIAADTVVLSLPTPAVSRATVDALANLLPRGALIIETSTVTPADAAAMHARCAESGIGFIDAAILSGVELMERGASALLIGGAEADVARAKPVLNALTSRQTYLGPVGAGSAMKVINNAVAHAVYVVLAEANAMAGAAGIDVATFVDLLRGADSGLMRPLTHRIGERLAQRDFAPGMRTDAARKDSVLALDMAQQYGIPLFAIQAAHTAYEQACARGLGAQDYAAVATLWDR
jgi:3-hydroxyisobutyrate dehydrogenase-like beta-hydroxyacid dehydrogenase